MVRIRGKLNGIGFAQKLNLEVDSAQHLVVRDVSLQGSTLALPGSSAEGLPSEIKQQLEELESDWRKQHALFSEQQKCLFIPGDWLGRIEEPSLTGCRRTDSPGADDANAGYA